MRRNFKEQTSWGGVELSSTEIKDFLWGPKSLTAPSLDLRGAKKKIPAERRKKNLDETEYRRGFSPRDKRDHSNPDQYSQRGGIRCND